MNAQPSIRHTAAQHATVRLAIHVSPGELLEALRFSGLEVVQVVGTPDSYVIRNSALPLPADNSLAFFTPKKYAQ